VERVALGVDVVGDRVHSDRDIFGGRGRVVGRSDVAAVVRVRVDHVAEPSPSASS
jgi:hypothetical protein